MQTLRTQLFQNGFEKRERLVDFDVMMMSPGCGLARSPNHDQVLAKPRPGDIIITSQNRPDLPAF